MKIDPNIQLPGDPQANRVANTATKAAAPSRSSASAAGADAAVGEDTFSLSSAHGEIQTLTAQLAKVPEVRTQRVAALQQRVNSGSYQPDSQKVADAIIADQAGRAK